MGIIALSVVFRKQVNAGNQSAQSDTAKQEYHTVYQSNAANQSSKKEARATPRPDPPGKGSDGF